VIPKTMRDELELTPGDVLELDRVGEEIKLRPIRGTAQLRKKRGVLVFRTGEPLSAEVADSVLEQIRKERDKSNMGR